MDNATVIGANAIVDASNKVRIGDGSVSSNGGQVAWTAYSDARIKDNVNENVPGLAFIKELRPVTYHYNVNRQNKLLGISNDKDRDSKYDIEKIQFSGFLAQDVDAAANKIGYTFSGVDKSGKILGLRYAEFVVPLVKAVQEQQEEIEKLQNTNEINEDVKALQETVVKQEALINDLMTAMQNQKAETDALILQMAQFDIDLQKCCLHHQESEPAGSTTLNDKAHLAQNFPNPFNQRTIIKYYLPQSADQVQIRISDIRGKLIKVVEVHEKGYGQIEFEANLLAPGTYVYELHVGNERIDSKRMIIQK